MPRSPLARAISALVVGASSTCALAQTSSPPVLEEVSVTARRTSESLQDVPVSVTAVSADRLSQLGALDIGDIQNLVPNLVLHEGDAANAVAYIRGVGQVDSLAFADPGVGIYLDDVYLGRAQGAFLDLIDVERVEVLRGPQGTLYGRNTIGGAIKYVTKRPDGEFTGDVTLRAGNYDRRDVSASIGGTLVDDRLFAKASVARLERDGFSTNAATGEDDGDQETVAARLSLLLQASDTVDVSLDLDSTRAGGDFSRTPARATPVFGVAPASEDPFVIAADFNDVNELDTSGAALTVNWSMSEALLFKSITASRAMDYETHLDLDATALPFFGIFVDQAQEQFSQEFQLNYQGFGNWSAVGGLYYFHEEDVTESGVWGPAIAFISNSENDQTTDSYAAYGELEYRPTEKLSWVAGIRYTYETKEFKRIQEFFGLDASLPPELGTGARTTDIDVDDSWSNVTPKLGVDYQLNDDSMIYASISKGFKSGGFDGRSNDAFGATPYNEETLWAYEFGWKATLLDQRVQLNTAVFLNDYDDLQLSSFTADDQGNFQALFTNAGRATTAGLELEMSALLAGGVVLDVTAAYLDAEYDEFIGPNGQNVASQRELVNSPELTGRIALRKRWDLSGGGQLSANADWSYRDETYPTVSSSEVLRQDSYSLWNASLRYTSASERWDLTLSGRNLGDERFITQGFDLSDSLGYELAYYGAPRTGMLTLDYRF